MKTAALLPTPGDTFVSRYWCRNYERVWKGEVDELIVYQNGGTREAFEAYQAVGARVIWDADMVGHGYALNRLVHETDADVLVFVEDDAYVREPGAITDHLMRAAAFEVIGSPRGGMSPILEQAALDKWGPVVGPDGSTGHGLWPCFMFIRADILRDTDMRFESRNWPSGSVVKGLGYHVTTPVDTDTNTFVAFQLRERHPISLVGQWKELNQKTLPAEGAPWFHAGGLSNIGAPIPPGKAGTNEGRDYAHRLLWWSATASVALGELPNESRSRLDAVWKQVNDAGLLDDFEAWAPIIAPWVNWNTLP